MQLLEDAFASKALAESRPGQELSLVGPLGNGWPTLSGAGTPWVFLAGGVGSAPFIMAIEQALAGMDGAPPVTVADSVCGSPRPCSCAGCVRRRSRRRSAR